MTQTQLIQTDPIRYQPVQQPDGTHALNQTRLAFFVGLVAFLLPTVLLLAGLSGATCFYDSISHFYYATWLGSAFVGALVFIGTYLLAYQGLNPAERHLSTLAGYCAYAVALFPTSLAGCTDTYWSGRAFLSFETLDTGGLVAITRPDLFVQFPGAGAIHLGAAGLLFAFLAWFSLVVFTREVPERDRTNGTLSEVKTLRNRIYRASGYTIIACLILLILRLSLEILFGPLAFWNAWNLTFWIEAIALYAFGFSWMVKGRFLNRALLD